jgi:hypothetical protein
MPRRTPLKKLQQLGDILQTTLKKRKVILDLEDQNLQELWTATVGYQIAAQTRPHRIKGKTLYVKVSSSVWMHQLQFLKDEITDKINKSQEKEIVKNIYFSIGNVSSAINRGEQNRFIADISLLKEKDKKLIEKSIVSISDPELKSILQKVMAKEIYRRRIIEKLKGS